MEASGGESGGFKGGLEGAGWADHANRRPAAQPPLPTQGSTGDGGQVDRGHPEVTSPPQGHISVSADEDSVELKVLQ